MCSVESTAMHASAALPTPSQLAVVCAITCIAVASVYWTQPVLMEIGIAYDVSATKARLAFSACSIAYALAFFFVAPLTDQISSRRLAGIGLSATGLMTAVSAMFEGFNGFIFSISVQGATAAIAASAMFALMPRIAGKERLGLYFGLIIASSVVGITAGRAVMGLLTASIDIRGALFVCAGALLAMAALTLVLPQDHIVPVSSHESYLRQCCKTAGMLISPTCGMLLLVGSLLFFGYLGTLTFLTLRLQQAPFLLDGSAIGGISLVGLSAIFGAPLSGVLIRRIGSLRVAMCGLSCVLLAIVCLALAQSVAWISVGMFLMFFGVFFCQPAIFVRICERVNSAKRGAASSLYLLTCLGTGGLASAALGPIWIEYGWRGITAITALAVVLSMLALLMDFCLKEKRANLYEKNLHCRKQIP